ncbi:hypothetical protein LTR66_005611 [Elasticomyces elasticus]|nr:hypothetical protein LTR66_005611 [Elasticomyces elasticus]
MLMLEDGRFIPVSVTNVEALPDKLETEMRLDDWLIEAELRVTGDVTAEDGPLEGTTVAVMEEIDVTLLYIVTTTVPEDSVPEKMRLEPPETGEVSTDDGSVDGPVAEFVFRAVDVVLSEPVKGKERDDPVTGEERLVRGAVPLLLL